MLEQTLAVHCVGLEVYDAASGEHVLRACALPKSALTAIQPFVARYVQRSTGALKVWELPS